MNVEFCEYLKNLVDHREIVIDGPKGSPHPRYLEQPYPAEHGSLKDMTSPDSSEIDIWSGSNGDKCVGGILCTVALFGRDSGLKISIRCIDEIGRISSFVNHDQMRTIISKHYY